MNVNFTLTGIKEYWDTASTEALMEREEFINLWNRMCDRTGCFSYHTDRTFDWNKELREMKDQIIALGEDCFPFFLEIAEAVSRNDPYGYFPSCGFWELIFFVSKISPNPPVIPKGAEGKAKVIADIYVEWLRNKLA